jgi:Trp operon repressor
MSERLVAGGFSEDEWDDEDEADCDWWLRRLAVWRGCYAPLAEWRLLDQYAPLVVALRVEAKQVALEKGLALRAVWKTTRKRAFQMVEEVIDGPVRISNHHTRAIRAAYAKAHQTYSAPDDFEARRELAYEILMEHGDRRTKDAWDAYHMGFGQQSLFDVVGYERIGFDLKPTERHETIPDTFTSSGRDPGERSFLNHVLDDEDAAVTVRQKVISQLISEGDSYQKIGETLGVSKGTVASEVASLRDVYQGWLNDLTEESDDKAEDDDERHLHPID